jgi:16S rRNA (cytosine1402-N4)-methyltransferase
VFQSIHKPVMAVEVLEALRPRPGGRYVDGTIGLAGHAFAILGASSPTGWLLGCDRDGAAIEAAAQRLAEFPGRYELRRGNYADLGAWIEPASIDGVLLDLGVSSPQLDRAERGFSFQSDGPLDMRLDDRQPTTAAHLVNGLSEAGLATIFRELGEEPGARRVARAIAHERRVRPFDSTGQLARLIERLLPRQGKRTHPATRVFQALRMAVNDEIPSLRRGLAAACRVLRPGGRLAVITFHSGEDRVVKEFGREQTRDYTVAGEVDVPEWRQPCAPQMRWVQRKAVQPGPAEVAANPRARSAQLRVLEKIEH